MCPLWPHAGDRLKLLGKDSNLHEAVSDLRTGAFHSGSPTISSELLTLGTGGLVCQFQHPTMCLSFDMTNVRRRLVWLNKNSQN
jgi:hypothetical protein